MVPSSEIMRSNEFSDVTLEDTGVVGSDGGRRSIGSTLDGGRMSSFNANEFMLGGGLLKEGLYVLCSAEGRAL